MARSYCTMQKQQQLFLAIASSFFSAQRKGLGRSISVETFRQGTSKFIMGCDTKTSAYQRGLNAAWSYTLWRVCARSSDESQCNGSATALRNDFAGLL